MTVFMSVVLGAEPVDPVGPIISTDDPRLDVLMRSENLIADAKARPRYVLLGFSVLPHGHKSWLFTRRQKLEECARSDEVADPIRYVIVDLLTSTVNSNPEHMPSIEDQLRWEGIRYNIFKKRNYALSVKQIAISIVTHELSREVEAVRKVLVDAGWQLVNEDLDYVMKSVLPGIQVDIPKP